MNATILKIAHTGDFEFADVETDECGDIGLETLQEGVGGMIECVPVPEPGCKNLDLWLNEEGKYLSLPINETATSLAGTWKYGDCIVGDVAVCGHDGEGRSIGLTKCDEDALRKLLAKIRRRSTHD